MSKKSELKRCLQNYPTSWIIGSYKNPNKYMSKTILALHLIVLRERGIDLFATN